MANNKVSNIYIYKLWKLGSPYLNSFKQPISIHGFPWSKRGNRYEYLRGMQGWKEMQLWRGCGVVTFSLEKWNIKLSG